MDDYIKELKEEIARAEAEKQALVEEFKESIKDGWNKEKIREKIGDLLPTAYESLADLILNAESEAVRAGLIKYVFSIVVDLDPTPPPTPEDPDKEFKVLLAALAEKDKNEKKATGLKDS